MGREKRGVAVVFAGFAIAALAAGACATFGTSSGDATDASIASDASDVSSGDAGTGADARPDTGFSCVNEDAALCDDFERSQVDAAIWDDWVIVPFHATGLSIVDDTDGNRVLRLTVPTAGGVDTNDFLRHALPEGITGVELSLDLRSTAIKPADYIEIADVISDNGLPFGFAYQTGQLYAYVDAELRPLKSDLAVFSRYTVRGSGTMVTFFVNGTKAEQFDVDASVVGPTQPKIRLGLVFTKNSVTGGYFDIDDVTASINR
jgi:hypothetical protein